MIPFTWEAEARESLEPGRQRFQGAEITALHSSLGDRVRPNLRRKKKIKQGKKKKERDWQTIVQVPNVAHHLFYKVLLKHSHAHSFYICFMAAFQLQWQS